MSLSRRRPAPPVLSPAEAEIAEWILSGDELPDDLDSYLQTVVMAKLMLSLSPAEQQEIVDDPDIPPALREVLLEGIVAHQDDDEHDPTALSLPIADR